MKDRIVYERIRWLREDNDYTQKQIGELLGISQRGYAHYESGDYDLTGEILIALAKHYNTSVDYLLGITNETKPYPRIKKVN